MVAVTVEDVPALEMIAMSIGSLSSFLEARDPKRSASSLVKSAKVSSSETFNSFFVIVPVLSAQRTSIPAISSIETSLLTMASFLANARAPTAMVTVRTAGIATGMAATSSTSANCPVPRMLWWRNRAAIKMVMTSALARIMR